MLAYGEKKLKLAPLLSSECAGVEFVEMTADHGPLFEEMLDEYRAANDTSAYDGMLAAALDGYPVFYALLDRMRLGDYPEPHNVPMEPYFLRLGGQLVVEVYVHSELFPQLKQFGGHIGYKIRPSRREHGPATRALRFALRKTAELAIKHALVTCASDNVRSARVIEKCGGVRIADSQPPGKATIRRYLVPSI